MGMRIRLVNIFSWLIGVIVSASDCGKVDANKIIAIRIDVSKYWYLILTQQIEDLIFLVSSCFACGPKSSLLSPSNDMELN